MTQEAEKKFIDTMREQLFAHADPTVLTTMANMCCDEFLDRFNEFEVTNANSIIARVLVAKAIVETAARWFAENNPHMPQELALEVVRSIYDAQPGMLGHVEFTDNSNGGRVH